jgi:hypothetical protein
VECKWSRFRRTNEGGVSERVGVCPRVPEAFEWEMGKLASFQASREAGKQASKT